MIHQIAASLAICISTLAATLSAQVPAATSDAIASLVSEDVVAIAAINPGGIDFEPTLKLAETIFPATAQEFAKTKSDAAAIQKELDTLITIGAKRVYVIIRTSDVPAQSPCFAIQYAGDHQKPFAESIKDYLSKYPGGQQFHWKAHQGFLVFGPSQQHIDSLLAGKPHAQQEIVNQSIGELNDHAFKLTIFGNPETRRVLRELMPTFERPFKQLTGTLAADGVQRVTLSVQFKPAPNILLTVDTDTPENAAIASKLLGSGVDKLLQVLPDVQQLPSVVKTSIAQLLQPVVTGSRVTISAEKLIADSEAMAKSIAPQLLALKKQAQAKQSLNNLRQVALAAHNFESVHGHFPDNICDEDGKPLLSWRVAILPFMKQNNLYKLFKLDEPWDSEHNLKLAENLPTQYFNPGDVADNIAQFKTTFLRPAGKNTLLDGKEMKLGKISDGTSNTIFALSVAPEQAVVWTRPTDWNYDPAHPKRGLAIEKSGGQTPYARCDASTTLLKDDSSDQGLRNAFTINDGKTEQP